MGSSVSSQNIPSDVIQSELLRPLDGSDLILSDPTLTSSSPAVLEVVRLRTMLHQYSSTSQSAATKCASPRPALDAATTAAADESPPAPTRSLSIASSATGEQSPTAPSRSAELAKQGKVDPFQEFPEVLPHEPLMRISYKSELREDQRFLSVMDDIILFASEKNKRLRVGGYLDVQLPFKFVEQTIFGREDVMTKLYSQIKSDPRHTVLEEYSQVVPYNDGSAMSIFMLNKINGGWGMVFRNRVKGVHYVIFDNLETASLKPLPKGHVGVVGAGGGGAGIGESIAQKQKEKDEQGRRVGETEAGGAVRDAELRLLEG